MYERCDGVRVRTTQEIDAIENMEKEAMAKRKFMPRYDFEEDEEITEEPLGAVARIVVLAIMAAIVLFIVVVNSI